MEISCFPDFLVLPHYNDIAQNYCAGFQNFSDWAKLIYCVNNYDPIL